MALTSVRSQGAILRHVRVGLLVDESFSLCPALLSRRATHLDRVRGFAHRLYYGNGAVTGAKVQRAGSTINIHDHRGVILCAAGFARNASMRTTHGHAPSSTDWTMTQPRGDTGDAINIATQLGAATALLDDSWWIPALQDPVDGKTSFAVFEMSKPYAIVVDASGSRFFAEAMPYADAGHSIYRHDAVVSAIPAWLVVDAKHRRRYTFGTLPPRVEPTDALRDGRMVKAKTLDELARQMGVGAPGLVKTVERWNGMCSKGVDEDFGKGGDAYQRYLGDPNVRPNPNMGPLDQPPFYATKVFPGDVGTKGGLLTDEFARVLREDGAPIPGLYAAGNTSAAVMGHCYCGAGATIGPAMTFGFIAGRHMGEHKAHE
ncbi:Uu.00g140210.m01.CDS01 [Anthostomella pinea]|uniref:Uu.00g140210.m01.CDS01 n=1 Tax=Anthostomella pinea TaxID=933095 RepID=A0AAI8VJL6_9PEZI|nr:Uu.00g140210.m01.CDS01 [Anthostomella pinea]